MFDTGHQGRADLVLAVPHGFDPINLPTTWLATDWRDHLPLMMEVRLHHRSCREVVAENTWLYAVVYNCRLVHYSLFTLM